jgi:hypothetical protein
VLQSYWLLACNCGLILISTPMVILLSFYKFFFEDQGFLNTGVTPQTPQSPFPARGLAPFRRIRIRKWMYSGCTRVKVLTQSL